MDTNPRLQRASLIETSELVPRACMFRYGGASQISTLGIVFRLCDNVLQQEGIVVRARKERGFRSEGRHSADGTPRRLCFRTGPGGMLFLRMLATGGIGAES